MTDKEKIRAYIESQIALLDKNNIDNPVLGVSAGIVMSELKHLLSFIDSLQEEPVSEDLEEAAAGYAREQLRNPDYPTYNDEYEIECAFEAGAQWQALHSLETIKGMEEQAFLAGVEAEQINKSFSKEELLNRWRKVFDAE